MIEVEIKLKIDSREKVVQTLEAQGFKRNDTVVRLIITIMEMIMTFVRAMRLFEFAKS